MDCWGENMNIEEELKKIDTEWYFMVFLGVFAIIPHFLGYYNLSLLERALSWIPAVLGIYLLFRHLGQLAFGQSAFVGLGSYIVAFLAGKYFVTNQLMYILPLVLVLSAGLAYVVGLGILRRKGIYFAVMSIGVTMVGWSIIMKLWDITNGTDGIAGIDNLHFFSFEFSGLSFYYLVLAIAFIAIIIYYRIINSPFGLSLRTIGENEERAEMIGIPVNKMQRIAYVIAGTSAGATGLLIANLHNIVTPSIFNWTYGGHLVFAAVIGGINYFLGAVAGPILFIFIEANISTMFPNYWELYLGIIIAIIVLVARERGILGLVADIYKYVEKNIGQGE